MHRRAAWPPRLLSLPEQVRPGESTQHSNDRNWRDVMDEYVCRYVHAPELHERTRNGSGGGAGEEAGRPRP